MRRSNCIVGTALECKPELLGSHGKRTLEGVQVPRAVRPRGVPVPNAEQRNGHRPSEYEVGRQDTA
jgi:hypothetical protein